MVLLACVCVCARAHMPVSMGEGFVLVIHNGSVAWSFYGSSVEMLVYAINCDKHSC